MSQAHGIHHVTAIAGDAQQNVDFYTSVLGLRLVKQTVNFDDPTSMHLYYGDGAGTPGTILTFFVWPDGNDGRRGMRQVGVIRLSVPLASLGRWMERFITKGVRFEGPTRRGDRQVIAFQDRDGLALELVAMPRTRAAVEWEGAPVPAEHAIRGIQSVQLWVLRSAPTLEVLGRLGYRNVGHDANVTLMEPADGHGLVEVRETGQFIDGREGLGTVHHVAFRVTDDGELAALRESVLEHGLAPTEVRDRLYFRSVYVREPEGVLFELATDGPGFTLDEPVEALGSSLQLPPQFESMRARLERSLPTLRTSRPG